MKTIVYAAVTFSMMLVAVLPSQAQIGFAVGLRTGLNFGTMSFDPQPYAALPGVTKGGRTGFMIGAVAELSFAKMFAVEISPTYVGKGATFEQAPAKETLSINELEFPILFKVRFIPGKIRPYAFVGPNLGIILTAKSTLEGIQGEPPTETDLKNNPNGLQVSGMDFALDFGAGAEFLVIPKLGIMADVRYSLGLSNLASLPAQFQQAQVPTWKTNGFQILVGALYHI